MGRVALGLHHQGREHDALGWADRAETAAVDQHDEETLLVARWVRALACTALGRARDAWIALDACAAVGRGEEVFWHARIPNTYGSILADVCLYRAALDRDLESLDAAGRSPAGPVREAEFQTRLNLAVDHLGLGDLAAAAEQLAPVRAGVDQVVYARFRWLARLHFVEAELAVAGGRPEDAMADAHACLALAAEHGQPKYEARGQLALARAHLAAGQPETARRGPRWPPPGARRRSASRRWRGAPGGSPTRPEPAPARDATHGRPCAARPTGWTSHCAASSSPPYRLTLEAHRFLEGFPKVRARRFLNGGGEVQSPWRGSHTVAPFRRRESDMTQIDDPVNAVAEAVANRATSGDGTDLGYWTSGGGPPLVLVHGATADHTRWRPVLPLLEPHATLHALDRRGRGASGDAPDYKIEREFEDVAAVVDAVAGATGGPVDVLGHSFGGLCALGGAALTASLRKLILYEPPVTPDPGAYPSDLLERLEALLAEGDQLEALRRLPAWKARIAAAHTLPREFRVPFTGGGFDPQRAATVAVPTLLLLGGDSPPEVKAEIDILASTLPDARIAILEGQQHIAMDTAPALFARHVLSFLRDPD